MLPESPARDAGAPRSSMRSLGVGRLIWSLFPDTNVAPDVITLRVILVIQIAHPLCHGCGELTALVGLISAIRARCSCEARPEITAISECRITHPHRPNRGHHRPLPNANLMHSREEASRGFGIQSSRAGQAIFIETALFTPATSSNGRTEDAAALNMREDPCRAPLQPFW